MHSNLQEQHIRHMVQVRHMLERHCHIHMVQVRHILARRNLSRIHRHLGNRLRRTIYQADHRRHRQSIRPKEQHIRKLEQQEHRIRHMAVSYTHLTLPTKA